MSDGDPADRTDSTVAGDQVHGADDIQVLPAGLVRLGDASVKATARDDADRRAAHRSPGSGHPAPCTREDRQGHAPARGGRRRHAWGALADSNRANAGRSVRRAYSCASSTKASAAGPPRRSVSSAPIGTAAAYGASLPAPACV